MFLDMNVLAGNTASQSTTNQNANLQPVVIPMAEETTTTEEAPVKRKRGRPRKNEQTSAIATISPAQPQPQQQSTDMVSMCQGTDPYIDTFADTNDMLKYSIMQLDVLAGDVKNELDSIRASKTLKGKYKYIADLCSTASSLVSSKISAIKEINAVTHNCHKLELQRIKDVKNTMADKQDDDKFVTDMYSAYINTPINTGQNPVLQFTSANVAGNQNALLSGVSTMNQATEDQGFQNYMANLTPEQNRMILGNNANIETVVVYNPMTGEKMFEVIDNTTGMSVPNYPRPATTLLDDTSVDVSTGMATNTNLGQSWKVVIQGDMINAF